MSEKFKVTPEYARDIVFEDNKDYKIIKRDIVDTSRWSNIYEAVVQHIPSGKYYATSYRVGATEQQDEQPFERDDEVIFERVFKKEKTIVVYE